MEVLSHGCTLDCFDCCKFNVYKEGSEILKIEGDKDHPFTKGLICKKGIAHLKRLNHILLATPDLKTLHPHQLLKLLKDMHLKDALLSKYSQFHKAI